MLYFYNESELPIEAAITMGISVKESDDPIGKFGTGLKYSIAGILRLNGTIEIQVKGNPYVFGTESCTVRDRGFNIITCNGQRCGFTTEFGKHWEPWQLFRELASNTLDEGGNWGCKKPIKEAETLICVECPEVEEAALTGDVFLPKSKQLIASTNGAQIYANPSRYFYYKGIRAGSFGAEAPVTVNVLEGSLSEDRKLDIYKVRSEIGWAFRTATQWDEDLILSAISTNAPRSFWVEMLVQPDELPLDMMEFIRARKKFVKNDIFRRLIRDYERKHNERELTEVGLEKLDASLPSLLEEAAAMAETLGIDPIPKDKIKFTRDLYDEQLAITLMDTREVWFSTKLILSGEDQFLAGYIEEALHAMTGVHDCTRAMQNILFSMLVRCGQKINRRLK